MRPIDPSYLGVLDPDQRLPSYVVALLPAGQQIDLDRDIRELLDE